MAENVNNQGLICMFIENTIYLVKTCEPASKKCQKHSSNEKQNSCFKGWVQKIIL